MSSLIAAAFYMFVELPDYRSLREPLRAYCEKLVVKGTILLAEEGINIQMISTSEIKISVVVDEK